MTDLNVTEQLEKREVHHVELSNKVQVCHITVEALDETQCDHI